MLEADLALQHYKVTVDLARQVGSSFWITIATAGLGQAYLLKNDPSAAEAALKTELDPEQEPRGFGVRLMFWAWGRLLLAKGDPEGALRIAERLLDTVPGTPPDGAGQPIPSLLLLKGEALLSLNRPQEAQESLEEAKRGATDRHELPILLHIQVALTRLHRSTGNQGQANQEHASTEALIKTLAATIEDPHLQDHFTQAAQALLNT